MKEPLVTVGLGEVLWDVFPDGPRFGGAPANFACSVAALGKDHAHVFMASSVGQDELGSRAIQFLQQHHVDTSCVTAQAQQTGQVLVQLDDQGCASYEFASDTAWDNLAWSRELQQLAARTGVVCFGTLGQRSVPSRETIQRFVSATPPAALRIFDINLRPPFVSDSSILDSLSLANVLKMNEDELPVVASLCQLSGSEFELMRQLAERYSLQAVALTRGPEGALLIRGDESSQQAGVPTDVADTVGAGDAFTAALALGLARESQLHTINHHACQLASLVCSQSGAIPNKRPLGSFWGNG